MKNFNLKILTGDKKVFEGEVTKLTTCDYEGQIGIYSNHSPYITMLISCKTVFQDSSGQEKILFTSNGIMKITQEEVVMLCEAAEFKEEIDFERAKRSKERAEKRLVEKNKDTDLKRADTSLKRALLRLKISQ